MEENRTMKKTSQSGLRTPALLSPKTAPTAEDARRAGRSPFPIVGLGASAGGLEALELFLQNVPAGSGMAFVIAKATAPLRRS
jgi:two-component system CheB/CheR fusion protein